MLNHVFQWFTPIPASAKKLQLQNWQTAKFLSIDLELTGLDTRRDEIVSIGWQPILAQQLPLGLSIYSLCQTSADLAQSPSIHGITERQLQTGLDTQKMLLQLAPLAQDYIWVFHNAALDMTILKRYLHSYGLFKKFNINSIVTLDTLQLQRYILEKNSHVIKTKSVNLSASREFFKLPDTKAHHALDDAFATAELLLAQLHQLSSGQKMSIKYLRHTGAVSTWSVFNCNRHSPNNRLY